jgi:hypothetical protein
MSVDIEKFLLSKIDKQCRQWIETEMKIFPGDEEYEEQVESFRNMIDTIIIRSDGGLDLGIKKFFYI